MSGSGPPGPLTAAPGPADPGARAQELEQNVADQALELAARTIQLNGLLYAMAHDLRAPLRAMQGFSEALLEDYGDRLDVEGRDYAARIVAAAHRMDAMVNGIVAYGRLATAEIRLVPVDLNSAIADVLGTMKPMVDRTAALVTVEGTLPTVLGRRHLVQEIATNLIENAIKFVADGVAPRVRLWAEPRGGRVRLTVEDNGIGIAAKHHKRIFGVFERLHDADVYPGIGLGLAIAQRAVGRLGGSIGVDSELGSGSKFWVEFIGSDDGRSAGQSPAEQEGEPRS
jgi:signal transduction histidine kinase